MCGRYFLDVDFDDILNYYDIAVLEGYYEPRIDIFPKQKALTVVNRKGVIKAVPMQWGIEIPTLKKPVINGRIETVYHKQLFKKAIISRRALVPASGYYEWLRREDGSKQKYQISLRDESLFCFAAVFNVYQLKDEKIAMVVILTNLASEQIRHIHSRMPVMLNKSLANEYLHNDSTDVIFSKSELLKLNYSESA